MSITHSQPYKASWVNSISIDVKNRCLILIQFVTYSDKIWCDVTGCGRRSWLYDLDVIIYGHLNSYLFVHDEKKVKLAPLQRALCLKLSRRMHQTVRKFKKVMPIIRPMLTCTEGVWNLMRVIT